MCHKLVFGSLAGRREQRTDRAVEQLRRRASCFDTAAAAAAAVQPFQCGRRIFGRGTDDRPVPEARSNDIRVIIITVSIKKKKKKNRCYVTIIIIMVILLLLLSLR